MFFLFFRLFAKKPARNLGGKALYTLAETTESEPIEEPAPTPVSVTLTVSGLSSAGLAGRRLWLWADGISAAETPYAVFTLTHADGTEETLTVPYDAYYDFADYNGRALLTLVPEAADGVLTLRTLLGFAVTDPTRTVAIGPLLLTEQYDTGRYADLADHWSSYFVNALSFAGVVSGSEDETGKVVYNPDANLSREQFAKILCGVLNLDTAAYADTALPFDDTASVAAWALPYVRTVFGAGLMRGKDTPDGRLLFAPGDAITREEAFYVLGGLFESDAAADTADFADADTIAPWAAAMLQKSQLSNWSDSFNLNKKAVSKKWIQLFFSLSAKLFELRRQKDCASFMPRFARHSLREKYFCRGTRPRQKCI